MNLPNMPLLPQQGRAKPIGLFAEILYSSFADGRHKSWLDRLPEFAAEYGFTHLNVHGAPLLPFVAARDFPLCGAEPDRQARREIGALREFLRSYKRSGARVTLGSGGPMIPAPFFEKYPEGRDIHSGLLRELIASLVAEYFEAVPEADELEIYLWEAMLVGDGHMVCPEMRYGGENRQARFASYPFCAPEDFVAEILAGYGLGASRAGKSFSVLTFSHYKWQEELLIRALKRVDRNLPIVLDHKCVPGDWTPQRLTNNVLAAFPAWPALMMFDGAGEYWGQCRIPYCYPEEIAHRVRHALELNPSIGELGMRVMWHYGAVFGNFNEINLFALAKLAQNRDADIGEIWGEWAAGRFGGGEPAAAAVAALRRTAQICNLIFYVDGAWVFSHSELSDLAYLESHIVNYSKSIIEWNADDFRTKGRLRELVLRPSAYTLAWLLEDRAEAARLAQLSLGEVRTARSSIPQAEYEKLSYQLELLLDIAVMASLHMELFIRYWIAKKNRPAAPADNDERFSRAEGRMLALADAYGEKYGQREPLVSAERMRAYAAEVSEAKSRLP
jgi:hypothetical protein